MTQPVTSAPRIATDHFDHDLLEAVRSRVARLDLHQMQIAAAVRLCAPAMPRPIRATPN